MVNSLKNILAALMFTSATATAGPISYSDYNGDSNGLITFEDIGQEWLNLDQTKGRSYSEAFSHFSQDGFRVATESDLALMLTDIGIAPNGNCAYLVDDTNCRLYSNQSGGSESDKLRNVFDATYSSGDYSDLYAMWDIGQNGDVSVDWSLNAVYLWADSDAGADEDLQMTNYYQRKDSRNRSIATFFVRDVVAQVPEPSVIALMGAGLAGLGFARRRKSKPAA